MKAECAHDWKVLPVPAEPPGRVFQCTKCGTCGAKRWGKSRVYPLACTVVVKKKKCRAEAKVRLKGRGLRDSFRWACAEHAPKEEIVASAGPGVVG